MGVGPPEVAVDLEPAGPELRDEGDGRVDQPPPDPAAATGLIDDQRVERADQRTLVQLPAHNHDGHTHDALVGSLDSLVVDKTCRGGGVGRRLVDAAITHVSELGARRLEVHSNFRRPAAHRFYVQLGFAETSRFFVLTLGAEPAPPGALDT